MMLVNRGAARRSLVGWIVGLAFVASAGCASADASDEEATGSVASAWSRGVLGDVDGDGRGDIALTGGVIPSSGAAWTTIPVAYSKGDGTFRVSNRSVPDFPLWATQYGAKPVAGDFDGDGRTDLALVAGHTPTGAPWNTVPVALSNGDGTFRVSNRAAADFALYATQAGAQPVAGDFNGDGRTDIALSGGFTSSGAPWNTIPVAFSNGDGSFRVVNLPTASFPLYATQFGAQLVAGDFDHDGRDDLALTGGHVPPPPGSFVGPAWNTVPVAFSNGDGTFRVTNASVSGFSLWATQDALAVAGDFDGDGRADIALTGGHDGSTLWNTVPVAFSNGNGTFRVTNVNVGAFATWATQGAQVVAADFDHDGRADLALTGGAPWNTIPVAFSRGDGSFRVTNAGVVDFPAFATQSGARTSPTAVSASERRHPFSPIIP